LSAAAAAEEPQVTQAATLIQTETSEPRVESEQVTDTVDERNETATDATVADEVTSHAELSTGEYIHCESKNKPP